MILLTGGTGFVGRHLVDQLISDGRSVRVLSRAPGSHPFPAGVECVRGNLSEPESLLAALHGVGTVVHLAAVVPGGGKPASSLEQINAEGTAALARAARATGVSRFVHVSSAGVYGDGTTSEAPTESTPPSPGTPYERSKLAGERALEEALEEGGVRWSVLRPTGVFGAGRPATAAFFREVSRRRVWLHGPSRVIVHPLYVMDLVRVIGRALDHPGLDREILNVGGDRPLEYRELIALIGARAGRAPVQLSAPRWTGTLAADAARLWRVAGAPPAALARLSRPLVNRSVDIRKARRLLGFDPFALESGVEETVAELRRTGAL